ncbi:sugar ABC transporter ATP-binding protein [Actinomadura rubrisoli]|uniref:Sugar ABC transporter ATP-binding protein n=1 Tax=Actinomadura rubrisoli TaxID=2530368 RepID=A0A4R5ANB2_9ACTN|nr:sugar ABC transporter ATP-binding protein [Actinomadura rubrisoli]TDD73525.1 sugar ABC transporter ATP-binding protein [Actinomadura rubrisoli]
MDALLTASGLVKRYPGVTALDGVDLDVLPGEVHVLVGENGAGKSTLVKCLTGVERPDSGTMTFAGRRHDPANAAAALRAGIQVVHQELTPIPGLTVAENLFLQRLPHRFGVVDRRRLDRRCRALLDEVGLDVPPGTRVERLGIAQVQLVEIAKALSQEARLLVLDEPTATLTSRESGRLFEILRRLTGRGVAVVYISHHLEELYEIGDRVTVLRNGRHVATRPLRDAPPPELVRLMVGRDLDQEFPVREPAEPGEELLRVEDLRVRGAASGVSFAVRSGEIVGVAGLVGAGRSEAMRALFAADRSDGGRITVRGRPVRIRHPRHAVAHGIGLLTEDRKAQGLALGLPISANISLASLGAVARAGLLRAGAETRAAERMAGRLRIGSSGVRQAVRTLSGGNQQKVVLARWLQAGTDVLIIDEPTRGIDVGARYEIHRLLMDLADEGKGLLVVSSDLPELMGVCDRILVFSRGRVVADVPRSDFDAEHILTLAYSGFLHGKEAERP